MDAPDQKRSEVWNVLNICVFGGQTLPLHPDKRVYLTLFGGCEIKRPTVARQIVARRSAANSGRERPWSFFFTMFGGAEVKAPTLVEEYLDLVEAVRSGQVSLDEWDRNAAHVDDLGPRITSFTIFGGFEGEELPDENAELDAIALQHHLGTLPPAVMNSLAMAVGLEGGQRRAVIRQAAADTILRAR